jgi:tetratricopeptide (TPR) repeat protein
MWSALVPGGILAWRERRRAMHDLKGLQRLDEAVLGLDDTNAVNRAKVALEAGNQVAALGFWNEALARYPGFAKGSRDALTIMLGLRLFDDADALMREGVRRAPRDPFYAEGYAQVAERRGDNDEAILRWAQARKKCPGSWKGYVQGAICLQHAGHLEAAESLIEKALKRFPDNPSTWMQWAQNAEHQCDWPEALRRWEVVNKRFRHHRIDISIPRALAELGRFEEAETGLREAQVRWPIWPEIALAQARLAKQRGDNEEAAFRWAEAMRRFPTLAFGYREGFRHLLEMGRDADAEKVLLAAIDRFPQDEWPTVEYALLATKREDWITAETRWAAVRGGWPDRAAGYLRGVDALTALGRQEEAKQLKAEHGHRFAN